VLTFDADARPDARDLFINQAVAAGIAQGLIKGASDIMKAKGYGPSKPANLGIVSSARTDANQQAWVKAIKELISKPEYKWITIKNEKTDIYYPGPDETTTQTMAGTLIGRMGPNPDQIQIAVGISSMAGPALGSQYEAAAKKPDATKIALLGIATPNGLKSYIKNPNNPLDAAVLWNCMDLGYLSVQAAYQLAKGTITHSSKTITAGRLGPRDIKEKMIILGPALVFDKNNVDQFNY